MSIENMTAKAGPFIASGVSGEEFPFTFDPLDSSYLTVYVDSAIVTSGYVTTLNSSGGAVTGGTVKFTTPVSSGASVAIIRNVPPTQTMDLQNNTAFLPEVLERAYDKLTAIAQQLQEVQERAFVVPPTVSDAEQALRDAIAAIAGSGGSGGGTVDYAARAGSATNAGYAANAGYASAAGNAATATNADNASFATNAGFASNASSATNAGYATRAGSAAASGGAADYAAVAGVAVASGGSADYAASAGYHGPFAVASYGLNPYSGIDTVINGGRVVAGGKIYEVDGQGAMSTYVPQGGTVYLCGSSGSPPTFSYTNSAPDSIPADTFYTALADNVGGTMVQRQFGDVIYPGWGDGSAASFEYTGPFAVGLNLSSGTVGCNSGYVFAGGTRYLISGFEDDTTSVSMWGGTVYLTLLSSGGNITSGLTDDPSGLPSDTVIVRLAERNEDEIKQIQFGDITTVPWGLNPVTSTIISGGMQFPLYGNLTGNAYVNVYSSGTLLSSTTNLGKGSTYYAMEDSYIRVSVKNITTNGCLRVTIGGAEVALMDLRSAGPGITWPAIPVSSGATFTVNLYDGTADVLLKCDHSVNVYYSWPDDI
jgi:hypothetical protein